MVQFFQQVHNFILKSERDFYPVGDFWGVEKNQPDCLRENGGIFDEKKGISFCLVNSQRGAELFEKILPEINYVGSDFETISKQNGNLLKPTAMPLSRNEIMELYKQKGYEAVDQLYWKKIGYKKIYYYSGSNFERPAFQRLFQELEQGTINCILVKDLSRFGRNYIEVGRYLERIFPVMRVRLIAVTDNYDSQSAWKTSDSIMVPMRNLLNDAYCRDISVKIKSQLVVKRKRGDFVGSFATYGYRKDPTNHSKLIVDELAAENVQSIFRWKISGMSNQGIADRLNARKVPSPATRKLQSGAKLSLHFRKSDEPPWSAKAVDRILHNEVYIGKLVQGKTRRLDYRSKKKMNVPMRDWTIVDNTHEAIVPAEQFELVQRILETETRRPNDAETVALFAGFLYCGDCGSRLVRRSASYKGKRYIYYQCSGSKQNKGSCTSHNLRDEKLYNIVRNALQMQIQLVMEEAEFVESIRQARQEPYRVRRIERQIRQLTAEKAHTQGIKEKLYGDYADEILTREDFLNYNELYSKRIEEYDRKITELEAEQQNLQTAPNAYPFLDVYRKYRKLEEITRPMVVELIEKIEVYEGKQCGN